MATRKAPSKATPGGVVLRAGVSAPEVSSRVWEHAIDQAITGNLRGLLELLLIPQVDSGPLNQLPGDARLRERIIWALMKSPASANADTIMDAWTRVYSGTKGRLNDVETGALAIARKHGGDASMKDIADSLGLSGEYAVKLARKRRRRG